MILQRIFHENRYCCVPGLLPDAPELRIDDFVPVAVAVVALLFAVEVGG